MTEPTLESTSPWSRISNPSEWKALFKRGLIRNIISLYGMQIFNQLLQLATIPYLARVLTPAGWGRLALAQSVGMLVQLSVGYGFTYSGARDVAKYRGDAGRLSKLVSSIIGGQALLAGFAIAAVAVSVKRFIPALADDPLLLWCGLGVGLMAGLMPFWYFQGQERMGRFAMLDISLRVITSTGAFLLVHKPEQGWRMLATQAIAGAMLLTLAYTSIFKELDAKWPTVGESVRAIRESLDLFIYTSAASLLTIGSTFLLGFFATPTIVGYYAGAEKISRAFVSLLWPLHQAIYPRVSRLCHVNPPEGARLMLRSLQMASAAGGVMSLGVILGAPLFIHLVLSEEFGPAINTLRLMGVLVLLIPVNIVVGLQWALPMGLDKPYSRVMWGALIFHVSLACLLAPRLGHFGMALTTVCTEVLTLVLVVRVIQMVGQSPFVLARQRTEVREVVSAEA